MASIRVNSIYDEYFNVNIFPAIRLFLKCTGDSNAAASGWMVTTPNRTRGACRVIVSSPGNH